MLTKDVAFGLAENWIKAWNAHDLDRIMAHYEEDVELSRVLATYSGWSAEGYWSPGAVQQCPPDLNLKRIRAL